MDTEKPVSYMKPCLDHQFDQPLIVRDILCPSFLCIGNLITGAETLVYYASTPVYDLFSQISET